MKSVEFPDMRLNAISALMSLADSAKQDMWGQDFDGLYYDDLTMDVNILYDDCEVLPNPEISVGSVVHLSEVAALREVDKALRPLLDELGESPDEAYRAHPGWGKVMAAAAEALRQMEPNDW